MATLPLDVITHILLLLPAKYVLICKSVCKLWYDLINGPDFIKLHHEQSLATQSNHHFVFNAPVLHFADFDTFHGAVELEYPFKNHKNGVAKVVGSCHGLLCLFDIYYYGSLFLYNPTTRTHKLSPFLPISSQFDYPKGRTYFGFGYDSFSQDYKCVRILQVLCKEAGCFESEVMVYSLKNDSWRRVQGIPYYFYCHNGGSALVGGAIHWVGHDANKIFLPIVSFDLKEETFSSIPLPTFHKDRYLDMSVGVLDDCLCLIINHLWHSDIWIMKQYGMPASWTRLVSVAKREYCEDLVRPVSFSMSRKELFLMINSFQTAKLDMETMEVTNVEASDLPMCLLAWVCEENLLILRNVDGDPEGKEGQERKRHQSKRRRKRRKNRRSLGM